jgi:hypothetical protein
MVGGDEATHAALEESCVMTFEILNPRLRMVHKEAHGTLSQPCKLDLIIIIVTRDTVIFNRKSCDTCQNHA